MRLMMFGRFCTIPHDGFSKPEKLKNKSWKGLKKKPSFNKTVENWDKNQMEALKECIRNPKIVVEAHMLVQRIKQQLKTWSTEAKSTKGITFSCNLDNASMKSTKSTKSLRSKSTKSGRSSKSSPSKKSQKKLPKMPEEPSPFNWDPSGNTNPKQSFNWDKKSVNTNVKTTDTSTVTGTPLGEFKKFFAETEKDMATKMTEIHENMVD